VPVLVTAAHQPLARRIASRLLEEGGEVRVYSAGDTTSLRAAGAFVSSGTPDDEGRLEAALADVHTLVHVGGGILTRRPDRIVAEARTMARAAGNAGVRRLIVLSIPGADPAAGDPLRQAKGEVEGIVAASACPSIVLRTSLVDTPALRDALATGGLGPEELAVEVAPVRTLDLVELVVAFDRARSRAEAGHLLVAADGPRRLSVAGYLDRVGATRPGTGSLVGRRLTTQTDALRETLLGGPWWTDDEAVIDGWAFADLEPGVPGVD
jgi:uncharacterized protein YbjT (DUF2867 family)